MERIVITTQDETEKKVLLAFLDSLDYEYYPDDNSYQLNDGDIKEMLERKAGFLNGSTTARSWQEIKADWSPDV
ncbi:MAG: hypothetical protein INR69_09785 [Mucilaginibacter polytrichastri]|nr:hypothetical protein [Mucilaginibacter polytrichastri]